MRILEHQPGHMIQSFQVLIQVSRLAGLAYPDDHSASVEADAVDCFINAFPLNRVKERMRDKGFETLMKANL